MKYIVKAKRSRNLISTDAYCYKCVQCDYQCDPHYVKY
ncbi:hypothetical protein SAMN05216351_11643 [Pseudobutyrivibrio sp. JW11]|nr:hypothetical protein SAMN05216351_11643 [Pseudobutyrivibrio sp. JW11]